MRRHHHTHHDAYALADKDIRDHARHGRKEGSVRCAVQDE